MDDRFVEYLEAFLCCFSDSCDIPRMDVGDIDMMELQKWSRSHGMSLLTLVRIIKFGMTHPFYDRDVMPKGFLGLIETALSKKVDQGQLRVMVREVLTKAADT